MKKLLRKSLLLQVIKQLITYKRKHIPFSKVPVIRGFKFYFDTSDSDATSIAVSGKKHIINVLYDIVRLCHYWGDFPDSYFRLGMFLKNYDKERMYTFVPQDTYSRVTADKDPRYHILIDDKILFHDIMMHYGFPVPTRFFIFRNNEFRSGTQLLTDLQVDDIISKINDERIFVKRFTGGAASGVSIFTKGDDGKYYTSNREVISASYIRKKFKNQAYIFEKQILQDETLRQFNPDTVNTIRVLTLENNIIAAAVRFGGKGEFVDNISANGIACSIDIESGCLSDYGMKMYSIEKYYEHPDSKIKFRGVVVTQWQQIKELVTKALLFLPYYKSVGFDIATTDEGPLIVEINTGAGINLNQMCKDYGLACYLK